MKTVTTNADMVRKVKTAEQVGNTAIQEETVLAEHKVDAHEYTIAKTNQVIWIIVHLVGIALALRFIFLLFGARVTGFAAIVYALTEPFVVLFRGIFPAPATDGMVFDSATLLSLAMWYLLGYVLTMILALLSKRTDTEI